MARPGIQLTVVGNSQRLLFPALREPTHFDMAAALREDEESELLKNGDDVGCRKPLSLGIRRFHFHRDQQRGMVGQAQSFQILAFQMERHRFPKVAGDFIQSRALGHHGDFNALGDVTRFFPWANNGFDRTLE